MAAHSNILAWRIPWTEEPGRLQSIGSQRVRHDRGHWARIHAGREKTSHLSCCLYFLKFIFNWRTVVLQYRVGFCHTSIWINHMSPPSWTSLLPPRSSLVAQTVKCLPTMWETWVRSLSWEDPLEKEMATHSSSLDWILAWIQTTGA